MFDQYMRKLRALKTLVSSCCIYLSSLHRKKTARQQVDIVLSDARMEVYYYAILFSFLQKGYQVNLFVSLKWLAGTGKWIGSLFTHPLLHLKTGKPSGNNRIITDKKKYPYENQCLLNSNAFHDNKPYSATLPFPMHPDQYASGRYKHLIKLQHPSERPIRIMFSGNVNQGAYENVVINQLFKIPNRWQIVEYLHEKLDPTQINYISNATDWQKARGGAYPNQLVMGRWEWSILDQKNLSARVPNHDWLPTLGQSSFFMACPGIVIPNSHNCIEAMAMGSIPILSYGNLFSPPLVDGLNCLCFTSLEELKVKIAKALAMDEDKIAEMRVNVRAFYDSHLTPDASVFKLMDINCNRLSFYNEVPAKISV